MNLSVNDYKSSDPYKSYMAAHGTVLLDGAKVKYCIEADEEEGCVVAYVQKNDSNLEDKILMKGSGKLGVEILHGNVQILDPVSSKYESKRDE